MGTKFTVYDHGVSPVKAQGLVEKAHTRQELAAICYVSSASPLLPLSCFCALLTEEMGLTKIMPPGCLSHLTLEPTDQFQPDTTKGRGLKEKFLQV